LLRVGDAAKRALDPAVSEALEARDQATVELLARGAIAALRLREEDDRLLVAVDFRHGSHLREAARRRSRRARRARFLAFARRSPNTALSLPNLCRHTRPRSLRAGSRCPATRARGFRVQFSRRRRSRVEAVLEVAKPLHVRSPGHPASASPNPQARARSAAGEAMITRGGPDPRGPVPSESTSADLSSPISRPDIPPRAFPRIPARAGSLPPEGIAPVSRSQDNSLQSAVRRSTSELSARRATSVVRPRPARVSFPCSPACASRRFVRRRRALSDEVRACALRGSSVGPDERRRTNRNETNESVEGSW